MDHEIASLQEEGKFYIHDNGLGKDKQISTLATIQTAKSAIEIIHQEKGKVQPIYKSSEVVKFLADHNSKSKHTLTKSQTKAISKILTSKDRVLAIQGYAGTGKTTMLKLSKELAELKLTNNAAIDKGYQFKGITIATSARNEMIKKAKIDADVYDAAINKIKSTQKDLSKTIFVVDEASMISSSQALELIQLIKEKNSRLIFVGDRAQLQSVNEGRFFEIAQLYGMDTVEMTDIIRQTNPSQKEAAKHISQGEIYDALSKLSKVSELDEHDKRVKFFATSYVDMSQQQRDRTLLFAAKHNTIRKITAEIRHGLQKDQTLQGPKYKQQILNRVNLEKAESKLASYYQAGNIVKFNEDVKKFNIQKGDYLTIEPITKSLLKKNTLQLTRENGRKITVPIDTIPTQQRGDKKQLLIELYSKAEIELQENDKIIFTKSNNAENIANSDIGKVLKITTDSIILETKEGETRTYSKDSPVLKHLNHGYVLTNYKVQGKDKFAGMAFIESSDQFACDLNNFYVQITRAIHNMTIVTDDKNAIIKAIELNNNEKSSVLNFISSDELGKINSDEIENTKCSHSLHEPSISYVEVIRKDIEATYQKEIVDLVESYRVEKESNNQDKTQLSKFALAIISNPKAYKYAQKKLKYTYQAYRYDSINAQVSKIHSQLSTDEKEKLDTVSKYIDATFKLRNTINELKELQVEGNQSDVIKQSLYQKNYEFKLIRNEHAVVISDNIESYKHHLKIYSIGELNRAGVPQYHYDLESKKSLEKLNRLVEHANEFKHYQDIKSYLTDDSLSSCRAEFAFSLLRNKKSLAPHVFHFSKLLNIEPKAIYNKIYKDAQIHKETLFYDELTLKERACFDKVKAYKMACCETSKAWVELSKYIDAKEELPETIQSKFNESVLNRSKLAVSLLNNDDFKRPLEFLNVDLLKKETHEKKFIHSEVLAGLMSKGGFSIADKLHFAKQIQSNFKTYYPLIKSQPNGLKKLYSYVNYIEKKSYIDSLMGEERENISLLNTYQIASNKSFRSWTAIYKLKEKGMSVGPELYQKAIQLGANRDYLSSKIDIKKYTNEALSVFRINQDKLKSHQQKHQLKINELYQFKQEQKILLDMIEQKGEQFNNQITEDFNKKWYGLLNTIGTKKSAISGYKYALQEVPISDVSLDKKYTKTLNKYDIKFDKSSYKSDENRGEYYDLDKINQVLNHDPITTYKAIFGEPKSINSKEMRYDGGLVVSLSGSKKGAWFDFIEQEGGWPIRAIEKARGLDTKDAIKIAAEMSYTSPNLKEISQNISSIYQTTTSITDKKNKENRVKSAQSIWENSINIEGTLGEKYLKKIRGIKDLQRINVRFLEENTVILNTDNNGNIVKKINNLPVVIFPITNKRGDIKGVQRIFLDPNSGNKNGYMSNAKLSKGIVNGNGIIIQKGNKKSPVFVAEGPETAASIANVFPNSSVVASAGIYNIKNLGSLCKSLGNNTVIFASDNDGINGSKTREVLSKAMIQFKKEGFLPINFMPDRISSNSKTDWNDVLLNQGKSNIIDVFLNNIVKNYPEKVLGNELIHSIYNHKIDNNQLNLPRNNEIKRYINTDINRHFKELEI